VIRIKLAIVAALMAVFGLVAGPAMAATNHSVKPGAKATSCASLEDGINHNSLLDPFSGYLRIGNPSYSCFTVSERGSTGYFNILDDNTGWCVDAVQNQALQENSSCSIARSEWILTECTGAPSYFYSYANRYAEEQGWSSGADMYGAPTGSNVTLHAFTSCSDNYNIWHINTNP
jgi:hypothetical protein